MDDEYGVSALKSDDYLKMRREQVAGQRAASPSFGNNQSIPAQRLIVHACPLRCSLNVQSLPPGAGELMLRWFQEGMSYTKIQARLQEVGAKVSMGALSRHRTGHMMVEADAEPEGTADGGPMAELDILNNMIQSGAKQFVASGGKMSAEQLLRAIEMKQKLTEGTVFDAMFAAMKGVGDLDFDKPADSAPGEISAEERTQGDDS